MLVAMPGALSSKTRGPSSVLYDLKLKTVGAGVDTHTKPKVTAQGEIRRRIGRKLGLSCMLGGSWCGKGPNCGGDGVGKGGGGESQGGGERRAER